jgi:hypothetical protein
MSIESDNGEFDAIATGERSDGGRLGARGTEEKEKGVPDVRVEGMDDDDSFSLRKFAAFVGPGFLMCIAYVDPGNFESNLQAGCQFGYSLLWVLMWATAMGLYIQALSIRLGLATGWHLARVMRDEYPTPARYSLWILTELAIIASDVPEVIGNGVGVETNLRPSDGVGRAGHVRVHAAVPRAAAVWRTKTGGVHGLARRSHVRVFRGADGDAGGWGRR